MSALSRIPNWLRYGAGIAISIACLAYVFSRVDLNGVLAALETFQWPFMLAAVASLALGYTARIVRWSMMLRASGAEVSAAQCAPAFLGSIALNNVLPLRIGDIVRALVFPASIGVSRTTATSSLVLERLVDLATLVACVMLGLALAKGIDVPQWVEDSALVLAVLGFGGLAFLLVCARPLAKLLRRFLDKRSPGLLLRLGRLVLGLVESVAAMSKPVVVLRLLALSLVVWACETGTFYFVLRGFGGTVQYADALIVMAIATIATLVPSSPGYVGPFHAAAFAAAAMLGGKPETAASFAILIHLALWLPTTLAGGVAILLNPGLFSGLKTRMGQADAR